MGVTPTEKYMMKTSQNELNKFKCSEFLEFHKYFSDGVYIARMPLKVPMGSEGAKSSHIFAHAAIYVKTNGKIYKIELTRPGNITKIDLKRILCGDYVQGEIRITTINLKEISTDNSIEAKKLMEEISTTEVMFRGNLCKDISEITSFNETFRSDSKKKNVEKKLLEKYDIGKDFSKRNKLVEKEYQELLEKVHIKKEFYCLYDNNCQLYANEFVKYFTKEKIVDSYEMMEKAKLCKISRLHIKSLNVEDLNPLIQNLQGNRKDAMLVVSFDESIDNSHCDHPFQKLLKILEKKGIDKDLLKKLKECRNFEEISKFMFNNSLKFKNKESILVLIMSFVNSLKYRVIKIFIKVGEGSVDIIKKIMIALKLSKQFDAPLECPECKSGDNMNTTITSKGKKCIGTLNCPHCGYEVKKESENQIDTTEKLFLKGIRVQIEYTYAKEMFFIMSKALIERLFDVRFEIYNGEYVAVDLGIIEPSEEIDENLAMEEYNTDKKIVDTYFNEMKKKTEEEKLEEVQEYVEDIKKRFNVDIEHETSFLVQKLWEVLKIRRIEKRYKESLRENKEISNENSENVINCNNNNNDPSSKNSDMVNESDLENKNK